MKHEYKSQENFPVPANEVWKLISNVLEENVSVIDTADKKSGFLKTKEFNVPYKGFRYQSEYADCGELGSLYVYQKIIGYYEIFVSELDGNRTAVRIVPYYRASLWLGKSFKGWVPCQSRGYVEQLLISNLITKIKESHPDLDRQPKNGVDKEPEKISTVSTLKIQDSDNETGPNNLMIKYESALQEIKELNQETKKLKNEITVLKKEKNFGNYEKNPGVAELSNTASPPEMTIKSDNDVTTESLLNKDNKEHDLAVEPLSQDEDPNLQIYTIQTGSFLDLDRARVQFDFITDLLEAKDYSNLRIEKIGDVYAVRLGKYDNYSSVEDLRQKLIHDIELPIVLKAYIKENRIIKQQSTQSY